MTKKAILVVFCIAAAVASAVHAQSLDPLQTVKAFYKYSDARSDLFDRRHIESRKQWYTHRLYQAFDSQLARDRAYLRKHPSDKPFFGDGLDFKPLNERCEAGGKYYSRSESLGRQRLTGSRAQVDAIFTYPKACSIEPVHYRFKLIKLQGRWLIDDLVYPDGSTLTGSMRQHRYGN